MPSLPARRLIDVGPGDARSFEMAIILVLVHEHDLFAARSFLAKALFSHWEAMGHRVVVHAGAAGAPAADLAILHVDRTVVADEYIDAVRAYPLSINAATRDIGKRVVSESLVGPYDAWSGPVIVKTNANAGGIPERMHEEVARRKGIAPPPTARFTSERYQIYESAANVPTELRLDHDLVVERFVPERDPRGYASRHWLFLGDAGWCSRVVGPHPIVKGVDILERRYVDVPDAICAHRKRLGFEFGKIDFVLHEGRPVLLDANRTPALPANLVEPLRGNLAELARGIEAWLE
jgi:hypothetical protein